MAAWAAAALIAAGCGKNDAPARWSPGKPLDKNAAKISVFYVDDAETGYSYAHASGLKDAQETLGLSDGQITSHLNISETDTIMIEAAISEAIAKGANIIIATSWGFMNACDKLAKKYPDVVFAHASGYKRNETNFTNYFGRIYQARYLSGIAAGLKTKTGKIGYVAAMGKSNSEVTGGLNAFAMGAESANPDAEVYAVVTHSWYDPSGERAAARKLIAAGADVIAQHCDTPNPQIEAESAGVWGVGYNIDMSRYAPDAVLTSVIWNWGIYYKKLIGGVIDGSFTTEPYFGGLAEGFVDIAPLNAGLVAPETEQFVNKARERMLSGDFNVFDGAMRTNDGRTIGSEGAALSDGEIAGKIDWYYRNVTELK
jgi:basic membrane protein A